MIKKRLFIIPVTALLLSACNYKTGKPQKPDITTDTLTYAYQNIKERAIDCGGKKDNDDCTYAQINYPVFVNSDKLNDTVAQRTIKLFDQDTNTDLQALAKSVINEYEEYKKAKKKKPKHPFNLTIADKVFRQDSSLITIEISGSSFEGNNHPIALTKFINWNTKADDIITLNDIFITGFNQKLTAIAEKIFRKQENLTDTSSLKRDYFFKDAKFALNNNFVITPIGIRFLYNQYEIKTYSAGTTDLFIPYSQIKPLLKPNTVIARYIHHNAGI